MSARPIHAAPSWAPRWLHDLLRFVTSAEALFVLFLFAGRYKADPRFAWVPVDITLLTFLLSVAASTVVLLKRRRIWVNGWTALLLAVFAAFVFLALVSLLWTPGKAYGQTKVLYLGSLVAWCLVSGAVIVGSDQERARRLMYALAAFSVWIGIEALMAYVQHQGAGFVTALSGNYLGIGRVLGLGLVAIMIYWGYWARTVPMRALALAATLAVGGLLLVVGGRGPFLAAAATVALFLASGLRFSALRAVVAKKPVAILAVVLLVGAGVAGLIMWRSGLSLTVRRLAMLVSSGGLSGHEGARLVFWREALRLSGDSPVIGHGVGSWPVIVEHKALRGYPHNLFLEVLFELGITGFLLLLAIIGVALAGLTRRPRLRSDPFRMFAGLAFVNVFLNAMVSGDLSDNRVVFLALGLMAASAACVGAGAESGPAALGGAGMVVAATRAGP